MAGENTPSIRLIRKLAIGPFSWRWPENVERFDFGWVATAEVDGLQVHVRHGIGHRAAYGRLRPRSVTWVENVPTVEGVGADDFEQSFSLLSLIKVTKQHLRPGDDVPPGYCSFKVVVMAEEAAGPHSPRSLAVNLRQDDVDGWTRHALLRAAAWGRLPSQPRSRAALPPASTTGPAPADLPVAPEGSRVVVVKALLEYGRKHKEDPQTPSVDFTPNPQANELLGANPFAFLIGVLFDQGVPAERAWLAPYLLRQRLGHLDIESILDQEARVRSAVADKPTLHKYVEKMPRWLILAARRVKERYGGDAGAIWANNPSADELRQRLKAFVGIGQKKAAMAVEILARDFGVPVRHLERNDVAYDVHLRRVFLRTRLADRDDRDHMIEVARKLHRSRPGELDLPTWLIGRGWCHADIPNCETCPLTDVCPKDIERAAQVRSG